jgi:VIT1/CCC1 family predicted Fe2+/Mn2+ transporter
MLLWQLPFSYILKQTMIESETVHIQESHTEEHVELSPLVRDVIIGMSDGLTVPFAIAAGLATAAAGSTTIIIAAVLSEIAAGSISMGLGGYLASNTESIHYENERRREEWEVDNKNQAERNETMKILEDFGLSVAESEKIVDVLSTQKEKWVDFMMRFELGLEKPDRHRAVQSALVIGASYAVGGAIPLFPYFLFRHNVGLAFEVSIAATLLALLIFGYLRGKLIGVPAWQSMVQTVLLGGIASAAAYLLARLVA